MIKACIMRNKGGSIRGFSLKGHAGYGIAGEDLVCAAVSAVVFTAVGALDELAGIKDYSKSKRDGTLKCLIPDRISEESRMKADVILETMTIALKQIECSYGKYLSVNEQEV